MSIKERLFRKLTTQLAIEDLSGYPFEYEAIESMSPEERHVYVMNTRELLRSKILAKEIDRLRTVAGKTIIRQTKTDEQTSWHRGGLHYLETLINRLEFVANLDISKKAVDE